MPAPLAAAELEIITMGKLETPFLLLPLFYLRRPHISSNPGTHKILEFFKNKLI